MIENEIRIAIAEVCGIKQHSFVGSGNASDYEEGCYLSRCSCGFVAHSVKEQEQHSCAFALPDYLNDLNAMHEAEKVLSMGQLVQYGIHLNRMELKYNYGYVETVINATARQRAEAFLRTLNKWKD